MTMTLQEIVTAAETALDNLEHLTTEDFSLGRDRPARVELVRILRGLGGATPEMLDEYPDAIN